MAESDEGGFLDAAYRYSRGMMCKVNLMIHREFLLKKPRIILYNCCANTSIPT
jgi:hypothetical protein